MSKPHIHVEVICAWARGEAVQFYASEGKWVDMWSPTTHPTVTFSAKTNYRIKPKPREFWIVFPTTETGLQVFDTDPGYRFHDKIHVREVIDEKDPNAPCWAKTNK